MFVALCALIFVLPASIALLDSFAGITVFFYLAKKINRMTVDWTVKASRLNFLERILYVWKGFAPVSNVLNRPLQILVLAFFLSVLLSHYPKLSYIAFLGKFLKSVFLYFSFIEVMRDEKRVRIFLCFLLLSALITAISGVVQHYTGRDFIKGHLIGTQNGVSGQRISASFNGANGLGAYLLPIIAIVSHLLYASIAKKHSWIQGAIWGLFLALLLTCLCWTYSRSAWLGYILIMVLMVMIDRRKILLAGALFAIFVFIFVPFLHQIRHSCLIKDSDSVVSDQKENARGLRSSIEELGGNGRFSFWKKAVSIISTSPVWGTGLNTYGRIIKNDPDRKSWWYAHNCYLQLTAETGVIGLAAFLWFLFVLMGNGLAACWEIKETDRLTVVQGTVCGLFGFLFQSFFDNTFYTVQLGVFMWMVFAVLIALIRLPKEGMRVAKA